VRAYITEALREGPPKVERLVAAAVAFSPEELKLLGVE
jgi:hypothetical protein